MNSIIHETARIHDSTAIGAFTVIHENVVIGEECVVGSHVVIHPGTRIGNQVRIDDHAVLGKKPMRAANSKTTAESELPDLEIGDRVIIGTGVVVYRGSRVANKVLIADLATVRENVTIGEASIVGRGVAIENKVEIGVWVKLETNVYICAYSKVGDSCFIAPCVATSNDNYAGRDPDRVHHYKGVTFEKGARAGVNATVLPGRVVGEDAMIAAGAVLTRDAPGGRILAGVPARDLRAVPDRQLLENQ